MKSDVERSVRFRPGLFYCPLARGGRRCLKRHQHRLQQGWPCLQGSIRVDPVESGRAYNEREGIRFDNTLDPYAPQQITQERDGYRNRRRPRWERGR
ncbi:hypothetical protein GFM14_23740 [Rhizobium leguminosarum bv. viciae]|nr:hypothetical protein [Rhizobium leguminosarum bv. viciae]